MAQVESAQFSQSLTSLEPSQKGPISEDRLDMDDPKILIAEDQSILGLLKTLFEARGYSHLRIWASLAIREHFESIHTVLRNYHDISFLGLTAPDFFRREPSIRAMYVS